MYEKILTQLSDGMCKMSPAEWISLATLITVIIGGVFALHQWKETIIAKRSEILKELIQKTRDDEQIANVMDIIDWNVDFKYDGEFHLNKNNDREVLKGIDDHSFFIMIDRALIHFSYICYLNKKGLLKKSDLLFFHYKLRRIFHNKHICNYLYSIYHFSKEINTNPSLIYLIEYGVKNGYLSRDFYKYSSENYTCFL